MKIVINILLTGIGGSIAVKGNQILLSQEIGPEISLFVSCVLASIFYASFSYTFTILPLRLSLTRRFLDDRAKYEGYYVETFINLENRPASISKITYNTDSKSYAYWGRAFNENGEVKATWKAINIEIDSGNDVIRYFFDANIIGNNSISVRGYGLLEFNNGTGYFVDSGSNLMEYHHNVYKLTEKDILQLTGKKQMPKEEEWGNLAVNYIQKNKKNIT